MEFDVQQLSTEIRRIDAEFRETRQRYLEVSGRGPGRGRGSGRGGGRLFPRQEFPRRFNPDPESFPDQAPSERVLIGEPRVASAIAEVQGNERSSVPTAILKRPANRAFNEDPRMKDRNRRMFSSLLGTLEKFREENDSVEKSERWRKREEISKRAIQKTTEEGLRLREQERKHREERQQQESERMTELKSMRKTKGLQLIYARRVQHQELLLNFIHTSVLPVILWLPAKHNSDTQALLDSGKSQHEQWLQEQQQNFEKEKNRMVTGEGIGDETVRDCQQQAVSTVNEAKPETPKDEEELPQETVELQFQPVSEINTQMEETSKRGSTMNETLQTGHTSELPPAKKPKLNQEVASESEGN